MTALTDLGKQFSLLPRLSWPAPIPFLIKRGLEIAAFLPARMPAVRTFLQLGKAHHHVCLLCFDLQVGSKSLQKCSNANAPCQIPMAYWPYSVIVNVNAAKPSFLEPVKNRNKCVGNIHGRSEIDFVASSPSGHAPAYIGGSFPIENSRCVSALFGSNQRKREQVGSHCAPPYR